MVIVSQNVSFIIAAALAGLMFILITGGVRIQAENNAQTELRIANRAFINDVDNATAVLERDDTSVMLTSTRFLKSPDDLDGNGKLDDFVCRESTWALAPASDEVRARLQDNTLLSVANSVVVHATADCKSAITSSQRRVAVTAVTDESRFVYTNVAGVNLDFSNGVATSFVGLDPTSTAPADVAAIDQFRADNDVAAWYTDPEMLSEKARVIEAQLTAFLPITQENNATFKATSDQAVAELKGDNDGVVDPGGEQTRWVPNTVSGVFFQRSTDPSTGTVVGGEREGVQLSWTPRPTYECSPTQTLTYTWLLRNIRTGHESSGETIAATAQIATAGDGSAEVWNGGNYYAAVAARCNDIDGQSAPTSTLGTLTLPEVSNLSATANAAQTTHTATWSSVSSDPTTRYSIGYSAARVASLNDFAKAAGSDVWMYPGMTFTAVPGSPTVLTSIVKSGNTVVAGYPDTYRVRASTDDAPNLSGAFSYANYIYAGGTSSAPTITTISASSFTWTAGGGCASTTHTEYRAVADTSGSNSTTTLLTSASPQSSTSRSFGTTIGEGKRVFVRVDQRCSTKFTLDPTNGQTGLSPWSADDTGSYIRPVSAPDSITLSRASATFYNGTSVRTYGVSVNGCASGTTAAWLGGDNGDVTYSLSNTSRTPSATGECRGDYAISASRSNSVTIRWIAPPVPSAPSGGEGTYIMTCDYVNGGYEGFSGWIEWSASSNATSYSVTMRYNGDSGSTMAVDLGTSSSQRRTFQTAASSNNPGIRITVTANGPGGSASTVFTPTRVPGGCA